MIHKIGVIYQDPNSLGFLSGLHDRLKCEAELVEPPTPIGKQRVLTRRNAKLAWLYFQNQGVDLVVRFTDADKRAWQDVQRWDMSHVPGDASSMWICGVAANCPEDWLCLDVPYLAERLGRQTSELDDASTRVGVIKSALASMTPAAGKASVLVAQIVREAPTEVFRRWLEDEALRRFYSDCRAAAARKSCETPNELDDA
ncbi:MAG: hypothetical protein IID43_07055 [Planctomycetes bacterium]|nr:hypothetical protein [Planctomycetota bacterium]